MTPLRINRAFEDSGLNTPQSRAHIYTTLNSQRYALEELTTKQLSAVITLIHRAYHEGRASTGSAIEDGDSVWIGAGVDKLIPLEALRTITIDKSIGEKTETHYKMDFTV